MSGTHTYAAMGSDSIAVTIQHGSAATVTATTTAQVSSPLTISSIAAVSPDPRNSALSSIDVTFSEPIAPASFTPAALTLVDNTGSNLISGAVTISFVSGSTYQVNGLPR